MATQITKLYTIVTTRDKINYGIFYYFAIICNVQVVITFVEPAVNKPLQFSKQKKKVQDFTSTNEYELTNERRNVVVGNCMLRHVSSPHTDNVFSVTESYQFCVILTTIGHILADLLVIKIKINSFRNYVVGDGNTTTTLLLKMSQIHRISLHVKIWSQVSRVTILRRTCSQARADSDDTVCVFFCLFVCFVFFLFFVFFNSNFRLAGGNC